VLYFGVLKDLVGTGHDTLELEPGAQVAHAILLLRQRASNQQPDSIWRSLAAAVNREYADGSRILADGDELALLPPVSGG
jgi:molybdopterin converting factor small subunit